MTLDLDTYRHLKRECERASRECERAEGALANYRIQLVEQFGIESVTEAERLVEQWEKESAELEEKLQKMMRDFKNRWKAKGDGLRERHPNTKSPSKKSKS